MYKTVNIEEGKPIVDVAMKRATFEIFYSKRNGYKALKIIHGYGSSGVGGKIKTSLRAYLARLKTKGDIKDFVFGEKFEIFDSTTQQLLIKCPEVSKDTDLGRHNSGVTIILL